MCGLTGFVTSERLDAAAILERMNHEIRHRGPDDVGYWSDTEAGVHLAHRRLAILDLSAEGHQPMFSASGRFVIVFNGEIYNFGDIKAELTSLGHRFRGGSDTEVMLAAFEQWGLDQAVRRFNGMFAFALWDRAERTLSLVRDRLGIKPMYYGWTGRSFIFGSELKPFHVHPHFEARVHRPALAELVTYGYVPGPLSILEGAYKLQPGTYLTLDSGELRNPPAGFSPEPDGVRGPRRYWSLEEVAKSAGTGPSSFEDVVNGLEELLRDSTRLMMISDVPLGAFLSGGIDSSTIVALMQSMSSRPVKTFSIGFDTKDYDEAPFAEKVARHLGTEHEQMYVSADEAMAAIPLLVRMFDEPHADSSQIPTYLVSQLARKHVTVSLSGDGGDELLLGYNRYVWPERIWSRLSKLPRSARAGISKTMSRVSPQVWDRMGDVLKPVLPHSLRLSRPGEKVQKLEKVILAEGPERLYLDAMTHWSTAERVVKGATAVEPVSRLRPFAGVPDVRKRFMLFDQSLYLPDDLLAKLDRSTMAVSLEGRVPYLDHRVVEYAARIPTDLLFRGQSTKAPLRAILARYVPTELFERPKMGFSVPIGAWLRGGLRDWAESLLDARKIEVAGYLDPAPIRARWDEHLSGRRNWQHYLWDILMFQAWLAEYGGSAR